MKRLYRNTKEKKIAGICSGIGEIYGIDPTIVRIAVVFITVATAIWPGVVAYLVGWFIIPDKNEIEMTQGTGKKE
jgi:phage shock protein C